MGFLRIAPPHLQAEGVSMLDSDFWGIEEALQRINPNLYMGIVNWPGRRRCAIFIQDTARNPEGNNPELDHMIRICETPSGDYRIPDYSDLDFIVKGDMRREENSYENLIKRRDAVKASEARSWDNLKEEMAKDMKWRVDKEEGFQNTISMHDPKNKRIKKVR